MQHAMLGRIRTVDAAHAKPVSIVGDTETLLTIMVYRVRWTVKQREEFQRRWMRFREKYGVTQAGIAEMLEISVATVNRIERNKFVPRDETVAAFGDIERKFKAGEDVERSLAWIPGEASDI